MISAVYVDVRSSKTFKQVFATLNGEPDAKFVCRIASVCQHNGLRLRASLCPREVQCECHVCTQVEAFLKFVHYPPHLRPRLSALFTPGNENTWHQLLGVLDWLVCYLEYRDKVAQSPTGRHMGAHPCSPPPPSGQARRCSHCWRLILN